MVSLYYKPHHTSVRCHLRQTKHDVGTCKHLLASALVGFPKMLLGHSWTAMHGGHSLTSAAASITMATVLSFALNDSLKLLLCMEFGVTPSISQDE